MEHHKQDKEPAKCSTSISSQFISRLRSFLLESKLLSQSVIRGSGYSIPGESVQSEFQIYQDSDKGSQDLLTFMKCKKKFYAYKHQLFHTDQVSQVSSSRDKGIWQGVMPGLVLLFLGMQETVGSLVPAARAGPVPVWGHSPDCPLSS